MVTCFPHVFRSSRLPSVVPSVTVTCFWLVVVLKIMRLEAAKSHDVFFIIYFFVFPSPPQTIVKRSPHTFHRGRAPSPISSPQQTPTFGWLLCFPNPNGSHLTRPRPPLCFLMGCVSAPKTREPTAAPPNPKARALHGPIGSGSTMSWWHRWPTHGERRLKPLEGRAAAAHVDCCVLCGCVLCCARVLFTHFVE